MKRLSAWLPPCLVAALAACVALIPNSRAGEVGYIETFALARDRADALKQLIPGTEDYYYFNCLHLLNTRQYDRIEALTRPWLQRHGQTPRLTEIQVRHALVTYARDPKRSLDFLTAHLGLGFDHERETLGAAPNLPTAPDPKLIARDPLRANSFARWTNLDNFEASALDWLAAGELTAERRRHLLQRLQRPDLPNLPKLIHTDLGTKDAQPFGSYAIHSMLTLSQLRELGK